MKDIGGRVREGATECRGREYEKGTKVKEQVDSTPHNELCSCTEDALPPDAI